MKLIKLNEDHYIIVDDSEIKEGDLCYDPEGDPGHRGIKYVVKCLRTAPDSYWNKHCKKITHSTQPESLGMGWMQSVLPLLLSEVKELIGEMDVEKKAFNYTSTSQAHRRGFIDGYNQAIEDNKENKYTEEDIRKAILMARVRIENVSPKYSIDEIFQSLQPKTEWEVEFIDGKLKLI